VIINSQRETAIKFQINHDWQWRAFYLKRKSINQEKLNKAEPDHVRNLKELLDFDTRRMAFYRSQAFKYLKKYKEVTVADKNITDDLHQQSDSLFGRISVLKMR